MVTLPWELVSTIIEEVVDRSSLLSLCLTSKGAYRETSRWLYGDISDNLDKDPDRHYRLLKTLIKASHLASLVRSYTINSVAWIFDAKEDHLDLDDSVGDPKRGLDMASVIWSILPRALSHMFNLEYLSFRGVSPDPAAYWLLRRVAFQLKEMCWEACQEGEEMAAFLSTQRRLETLYLSDGLSHPVDSKACLTLRLLSGDSTTFGRILPGRPAITHLHWLSTMGEYHDHPLLPTLLQELHRITHFSIEGFSARLRLPKFGGHFRDLVAMKLNYIYEVSPIYSDIENLPFLTSTVSLQPEIPVIFTIPKLKILVLSTIYFASSEDSLIREPDTVLERLFEGTPPLCTIVTDKMRSYPDGTSEMFYYWWKRSHMAAPTITTTWFHPTRRWPEIAEYCYEEHREEMYVELRIYKGFR